MVMEGATTSDIESNKTKTSLLLNDDELKRKSNAEGDNNDKAVDDKVVGFDAPAVEEANERGDVAPVKKSSNPFNHLTSRSDAAETVERGLGSDTYSLFYIYQSPYKATFLFALFIFFFQIAIFTIMIVDVVDMGTSNPLRIPPGCSTAVRIMQTFGLLVALMMNNEVVATLQEWNDGYTNMQITGAPTSASRSKFILMGVLHMVEGLFALTV